MPMSLHQPPTPVEGAQKNLLPDWNQCVAWFMMRIQGTLYYPPEPRLPEGHAAIVPGALCGINEKGETYVINHHDSDGIEGSSSTTGYMIRSPGVPCAINEKGEAYIMDHEESESIESITSTTENQIQMSENMNIQSFMQAEENKRTKMKTDFDTKMLQRYLASIDENRKVKDIPHTQLDAYIAKFICSLKRKDGSEYEPGTVRGIIASIDRHLSKNEYPHSILHGIQTEFQETKRTLLAKQKYLKTLGKGNRPRKSEPLTEEDIQKLYDSGTMGMHTPTALLNLLFFEIGIQLALRTQEQYDLKWGDIDLYTNSEGTKYLEYNKRQTGPNPKDAHVRRPRLYENLATPDRDPIQAYLKYAASRPMTMQTEDSPFYLTPIVTYYRGQSVWYRQMKLGINKMNKIMGTMKLESGLPSNKRITNHSTRKTSIRKLVEYEIIPTQVQE